MVKHEITIIADYSEETWLSLEELADICQITHENVHEYIAYAIIAPTQQAHDQWMVDMTQLQRIKTALRLQRDLELNLAGVAMVLDLLDEVEELRAYKALIEKHTLR